MSNSSTDAKKSTSVPEEFVVSVETIDRSLSLVMHYDEVSGISEVLKALMTPDETADEVGEENDS